MNAHQIEGLIGMLVTLGILVLLILPSVFGIVRERRMDRHIRQANLTPTPTRRPTSSAPVLADSRTARPHA